VSDDLSTALESVLIRFGVPAYINGEVDSDREDLADELARTARQVLRSRPS